MRIDRRSRKVFKEKVPELKGLVRAFQSVPYSL